MRSCFLFLYFFPALNLFSASADSLLRFRDLHFKNADERQAFLRYQQQGDKGDVIDLFLAHYTNTESYSSAEAHRRIMELVTDLKKETQGLPEIKKAKLVYKSIHERFFNMYKLNNSFSDVFTKGEYNCVSGSAMHAIVFRLMDIPYQVVEAPHHVFLFAYPHTHRVLIETTSPKNGDMAFSETYIQRFIKYMTDTKLVTAEEVQNSSPTELFNNYYFSKSGLTIQELAGIQYANYAFYYAENEDYAKALPEAKKAYFLRPCEQTKYLLRMITLYQVGNTNYQEKKDVENFATLCRFNRLNKNEISDEAIRQEFMKLTYAQLITNSDYSRYDTSFARVKKEIADTSLNREIAFVYYYELSRLGAENFKSRDYEIPLLKAAYDIKPRHADLRSLIKAYFSRLVGQGNHGTEGILKDLELFEKKFDFIAEDEASLTIKANCFLELAYQHFMFKDASKGETELKKFEYLSNSFTKIEAGEEFVEKAYSTAAAYYYKKGNKAKAKALLISGVKYAPENFGLRVRLSQLR